MLIKHILILFLLTSCALFKARPSLKSQDKFKLLDAIKLTGEGTGRLGLGEGQHLFSVDSILKDNHDWILAVSIPLHGEEVMILPNLQKKEVNFEERETFEDRIDREFSRIKLNKILSTQDFLLALRSIIRFNLSSHWGVAKKCTSKEGGLACEFDGDIYLVEVTEREIIVNKSLGQGRTLSLEARNLTKSFFAQTDVRLYANEDDARKKKSSFSLELFWQE